MQGKVVWPGWIKRFWGTLPGAFELNIQHFRKVISVECHVNEVQVFQCLVWFAGSDWKGGVG